MGDGLGHAQRIGIAGRAVNAQLHHMRKSLAIGNHLTGERRADFSKRGREGRIIRADRNSAGARGQQQNRVVGGSVAVDGDAIEADLNRRAADTNSNRRARSAASVRYIDQHRRVRHQLGMDHAGAFAEGRNADLAHGAIGASEFQPGEGDFLHGVGGKNGARGIVEVAGVGAERGSKIGQHRDQLFRGQRNADDSGRRRKHLFGAAVEGLCRGGAGGARGIEPGLSRGAVGVARVDGHHAHMAAGRA